MKLGSIIFCDAIFFLYPSFAITNSYYTTSFKIMNGKKEKDYTKFLIK